MVAQQRSGVQVAGREVTTIVGALAAVCLAIAAVDALLASFAPLPPMITRGDNGQVPTQGILADTAVLLDNHLFGDDAAAEEVDVFSAQDLPATTLRLKLVGPAASLGGGAEASALIALPDGEQKRVRIDEEILPGVVLKSVERTQVVISRNGNAETLSLTKRPTQEELQAGLVTEDGTPAAPRRSARAAPREAQRTPATFVIDELSGDAAILKPFLEAQGFRGTDRILAIDGQPLPTSGDAIRQALEEWSTKDDVRITIQRGGAVINKSLLTPSGIGQ